MPEIGYQCATCGEWHAELPLAWQMPQPDAVSAVPESDRRKRVFLGGEQCEVDGEFFFVRGRVRLPVLDADEDFEWGVWVSLSRDNYKRAGKFWKKKGRESEPAMFGWLSNDLAPLYPSTLNLKAHVHTQPVGERPLIELEPTDHPLAREQREGITLARVAEIAQELTPEH